MVVCLAFSSSADKDFTEEGVNVKILGNSGKMVIKNAKQNSVVVLFDYIKELSSSGAVVGAKGGKKHSINTFAREQFSFTTSGNQSSYQGIAVKHVRFHATISGPGAMLVVDVYVFKAAGNITAGNETMEVKKGSVKFSIEISSWTFCGGSGGDTCSKGSSQEEGTQIELGIEIKGKTKPKNANSKRGKGRKLSTLDIGGAVCTLSGELRKDGVWEQMAGDYPKTVTTGPKTLFIFRFPKFSGNVMYDPTLELSGTGTTGNAAAVKAHTSLIILCAVGFFLKFIL